MILRLNANDLTKSAFRKRASENGIRLPSMSDQDIDVRRNFLHGSRAVLHLSSAAEVTQLVAQHGMAWRKLGWIIKKYIPSGQYEQQRRAQLAHDNDSRRHGGDAANAAAGL